MTGSRWSLNFNPRSPCGERRSCSCSCTWHRAISIHAPRVGSDAAAWFDSCRFAVFQSTLPVWGATATLYRHFPVYRIFQSTLPVWGATLIAYLNVRYKHFNPRSPCGERRQRQAELPGVLEFQSTLPVWGATIFRSFSISRSSFQSTLPVWGATSSFLPSAQQEAFQSTLPVWGATRLPFCRVLQTQNFNPRSPCGERPV